MARVKKVPQRMCVGCKEMKNKRDLIRIVRTPEGDIELDSTGKKAGRGAYICPNIECLEQAVRGKRLQKALEQEVSPEVIASLREKVQAGPI